MVGTDGLYISHISHEAKQIIVHVLVTNVFLCLALNVTFNII